MNSSPKVTTSMVVVAVVLGFLIYFGLLWASNWLLYGGKPKRVPTEQLFKIALVAAVLGMVLSWLLNKWFMTSEDRHRWAAAM